MPNWLRRNNNTGKKLSVLRPLWSRTVDRLGRLKQHLRTNANKPNEFNKSSKPSLAYLNYAFNRPVDRSQSIHECYNHTYRQCNCSGKCADSDYDDARTYAAPEGGIWRNPAETRNKERSYYEQLKRDRIAARIKAKRRAERRKEIRV